MDYKLEKSEDRKTITREQLMKMRLKAYMSIDFKHHEMSEPVECMLVGVNYDTEILILRPFPTDNPFNQEEFPVHISHCEVSRPKLKIH